MPVTWSDEKLILLYCPGRGSNPRRPAHRSFKHGQGVLRPYPLGHGGGFDEIAINIVVPHYLPHAFITDTSEFSFNEIYRDCHPNNSSC